MSRSKYSVLDKLLFIIYIMSTNEYILKKSLTENHAYFLFNGTFQQQPVSWHVHLSTCQSQVFDNRDNNRQFIEISPMANINQYHAHVCLNITRLGTADITKTIIMLNQYKNLSLGKHEYGEPF